MSCKSSDLLAWVLVGTFSDSIDSGGNDAAIVFPDVDVESVAEKAALYAFVNSGQVSHISNLLFIGSPADVLLSFVGLLEHEAHLRPRIHL